MSLIRRVPWTVQPQYAVKQSQRWAPVGLWNLATRDNAVSGGLNTQTSDATQSIGALGRGASVTGTANLNRLVLNGSGTTNIGSDDFTVFTAFRLDSTAGYSALSRWNTGGSAGSNVFLLGDSSGFAASIVSFMVEVGTASYEANVAGSWVVGETYFLFGRRNGTTIYVDRYTLSTRTWLSGFRTDAGITSINEVAARALKFGELDAAASLNANLTAFLAATFKRCITDAELRQLTKNPWQLFEPQQRYLFAPPAAGGAITIDCTTGNAAAAGTTASVTQAITINTALGNAIASGTTASIELGTDITIACVVGNAVAAGTTADVTQAITINASVGNAVAAGVTASVTTGSLTLTAADLAAIDALITAQLPSIAAAVLTAAQTTPIHSDVRKVNSYTVDGNGQTGTEWGPV